MRLNTTHCCHLVWGLAIASIASILVGCGDGNDTAENATSVAPSVTDEQQVNDEPVELSKLQKLISSEELLLSLGNRLSPLNRSARNLKIPFGEAEALFADEVQLVDIKEVSRSETINAYLTDDHWQTDKKTKLGDEGIWSAFLSQVRFLDTARFYFISGELDSDAKRLDAQMGFASHLELSNGKLGYASAKINVIWNVEQQHTAKIVYWKTKEFHCLQSDQLMFDEITSSVVLDKSLAAELATSAQEEMTRRLILGEKMKRRPDDKYRLFFSEVTLEHPAVSVVDVDADGLDDFFLARAQRPSLMFRNLGNGTFEEIGQQLGLRFDYDCTCALFADYDNDGDQDAFIGRARHRAVYMQNDDGKYVDRSDLVTDTDLPYMVSSICAADYDNNGMLDVYFSTYSPIEGSHIKRITRGMKWPKLFLSTVEQVEFEERLEKAHTYLDMVGPPNLLLKNIGRGFALSERNFDVESWRKSFQSSWCDFDQDGDQDLYVCNDFAPDDMFRNDGPDGFVRISDEVGLDKLGFGMGVSWRDHNNDGKFDLYVSNMFSKAGTRITKQIAGLDPRFKQMATGNYLYEFDGDKFHLMSMAGPNATVAKTGWSWGGQFTDFDNDGRADIVVANGYYSAPPEVEVKIDL